MTHPALVIIDMQHDFVGPDAVLRVTGAEQILSPLNAVLSLFRERNLPIFHVVRIHRSDGSDVEWFRQDVFSKTPFAVKGTKGASVIESLTPVPGEYILSKVRMSAFMGTELDLMLRSLGVDTLVITGVQTPNCIRTTAFDAMAYNYKTVLITDATGAQTKEIHESNIRDMKNIGILVMTSTELSSWLKPC